MYKDKSLPNFFGSGFRAMIPLTMGIVPFGAVVGTVCSEAGLSFFQTISMNTLMYAGAAQLATMDLMTKHAASIVVIMTGLIINLRFLLYSAAMSPYLQNEKWPIKLFCSYTLTDQSYAAMLANQHKLNTVHENIQFYIGSALCMLLVWTSSVIGGFAFGNFAPASWALDYAIPLSFVALVIPTLKNKNYVMVAAFSFLVSIILQGLPYRLGLIATALLSIGLAALLTRKRASS